MRFWEKFENALIRCNGDLIQPEHLHLIESSNAIDIPNPSTLASDEIPQRRTPEEMILAYIKQNGSINNTECRDFLSVDRHRAAYLLEKLERAGLLKRTGATRATRYRLR